jgi:general secretion pathway protein C
MDVHCTSIVERNEMKRLPVIAMFVLFIALCVSAAYWGMQLFKPPVRPVAAPMQVAKAEIKLDSAAGLFGGRHTAVAVASNFQLKGIIRAGRTNESIAILHADGKPSQAIVVNTEVAPGVTVKEVHAQYVLLSEGGVTKRVELPESAKNQGNMNIVNTSPVATQSLQRPPPVVPPHLASPTQTVQPTQVVQPNQTVQQSSPTLQPQAIQPGQTVPPVPVPAPGSQAATTTQSPPSLGTPPPLGPSATGAEGSIAPGSPGSRWANRGQ